MHIVILGGGGFLGNRLAKELLQLKMIGNEAISKVTSIDRVFSQTISHPILEILEGDFCDLKIAERIVSTKPDIIFHLAAVVSGEAEKNFELGMNVNLHGSLQLLEQCRILNHKPKIVFASSCAVFGGETSKIIDDDTAPQPLSSYGTQKAMVDLLMNDYSRRGFIDARCLRLPTITVRPGKPNAATSSFISSIIREPLNGMNTTYPVQPNTKVWIQSPKRVILNFIHAATLSEENIGLNRVINLPGITVTINEMIEALRKLSNDSVVERISYKPDSFIQSIVLTWPPNFETSRALKLGFKSDESISEIIQAYITEEGIKI